MKLVIKVTFVE